MEMPPWIKSEDRVIATHDGVTAVHPNEALRSDLAARGRLVTNKSNSRGLRVLGHLNSTKRDEVEDLKTIGTMYDKLSNIVRLTTINRSKFEGTYDPDLSFLHDKLSAVYDLRQNMNGKLVSNDVNKELTLLDVYRDEVCRAVLNYVAEPEKLTGGTTTCLEKAREFCHAGIKGNSSLPPVALSLT